MCGESEDCGVDCYIFIYGQVVVCLGEYGLVVINVENIYKYDQGVYIGGIFFIFGYNLE